MFTPDSTPEITRWCSLVIAIVLAIVAGASARTAIRYQSTGRAVYTQSRFLSETVTRESSPWKFGQAVSGAWWFTGINAFISLVSFAFYRKLSACDYWRG